MTYVNLFRRVAPFVFIAFFSWYGASFAFNARKAALGGSASLFGTEISTIVKAGLDYGFWIGVAGAIVLLLGVALAIKQAPRFVTIAAAICVAAVGIAFGFSRSPKQVQAAAPRSTISTPAEPTPSGTGAADTSTPAEPEFDSKPYIEVTSVDGRHLSKDYEASRFHDEVIIGVEFKNLSTKTIVGLRGKLSVLDGFGKEVYSFGFRYDNKIVPGKETHRGGGYTFEDNQFDHDEPYDRIVPLITGGTAKYAVKVTQIAFDDGSALPAASK
jgi:hypothetical protein